MKSAIYLQSCAALRQEALSRRIQLPPRGSGLDEEALRRAFSRYFERGCAPAQKPGDPLADAKELSERYGAEVSVVRSSSGAMRAVASFTFTTADRSIDPALERLVSGFGFALSLETRLAGQKTQSRYSIATRRDGEMSENAGSVASRLLRLCGLLSSMELVRAADMREPMPLPAAPQASKTKPLIEESLAASACMRLLR